MKKKFFKSIAFSLLALVVVIAVMSIGDGQDPKPMGTNTKNITVQKL